jgi:hypothetical protein
MKKRLLAIAIVLILASTLVFPALAQGDYYFQVEKEVVNVYWNTDGTMSLDYTWVFVNPPGAHVIDFVDVGMPNRNFNTSIPMATQAPLPAPDVTPTIPFAGTESGTYAEVNGKRVTISSDYQGQGSSGFSVDMGAYAIQPGQRGTVHVYSGGISGVLYPDDKDQAYASAVFVPTWFGSQYVTGSTDLTVIYHLPPGIQSTEPRWHASPSGFPAEPQTGFDNDGRVTYTWYNPSASMSQQYTFGASFPKTYIPDTAIITVPAFDFSGLIASVIGNLFNILCCGAFAFMFLGLPIISVVQGQRRKMQYLPPKISIEGHGIKRGLTAVEAAILMEQPLDKVMTMILFSVIKKGAAEVLKRDPLELSFATDQPAELHQYETDFLKAFGEKNPPARRKLLQEMTVTLVRSVSDKLKGFSRKESVDYYKSITERAWQQVEAANTPEVKSEKFEENLEWTMLDKGYDDRTRRTFNGPIFVPTWWGHYDPTYRPSTTSVRPISTQSPSMPSSGSRSLPGADFAASVVGGVQTFSSKVIGNVSDFTSRVTGVTNPPPKPTASSGRSSGGGGRSCACACACAGGACACAGGGR